MKKTFSLNRIFQPGVRVADSLFYVVYYSQFRRKYLEKIGDIYS